MTGRLISINKTGGELDPETSIIVIKEINTLKVIDAIESSTQLATLERADRHSAVTAIGNLLALTQATMGVKEKPNPIQQFEMVQFLLTDYRHLTIEEISILMREGRKGVYGPNYNKFDLETLANWAREYDGGDERQIYLETRHKNLPDITPPAYAVKSFQKIREELEAEERMRRKKKFDENAAQRVKEKKKYYAKLRWQFSSAETIELYNCRFMRIFVSDPESEQILYAEINKRKDAKRQRSQKK